MNRRVMVSIVLLIATAALAEPEPARLMRFTAALSRIEMPGKASVTFSVYRDQESGTPLWTETQTIDVDDRGRFDVLLGAVQRVPQEIFTSSEARWLGIQRIPEEEQPRILLAAVPYALKAADADTLGGKPLSAFVLAEPEAEASLDAPSAPRTNPAMRADPAAAGGVRAAAPGTPVSHSIVPTGFFLASLSGNTSIGFATRNGDWEVYLKSSSAAGFDSSQLRMKLSQAQLTVLGSVVATSSAIPAIFGENMMAGGGVGVYGVGETAVVGVAQHSTGTLTGGFFDGGDTAATNYGVDATGGDYGVRAVATGNGGAVYGVYADGGNTSAVNTGALGIGGEWGLRGLSTSTGGAAIGGRAPGGSDLILMHGLDTNDPEFRVTNTGSVQADGAYTTPAADLAERIDAIESLQPGDVVEIDPDADDRFRRSRTARSNHVAGVVSTLPGMLLNDMTLGVKPNDDRPALALAGRVPVKATTENGAIHPGDLLVASSTPGRAMRADADPAPGTVIGKALEHLGAGSGTIRMLVVAR